MTDGCLGTALFFVNDKKIKNMATKGISFFILDRLSFFAVAKIFFLKIMQVIVLSGYGHLKHLVLSKDLLGDL